MSHDSRLTALRKRFDALNAEVGELKNLRKVAFVPAPPMPQGPMPMDPSMMQGGAPPMDPAMMGGAPPMDPAMMGGAPPMDPAMMQGGGMPMDPAMAGGGQPPPPPLTPEMVDQIVGLLEEMGQKLQQQGAIMEELKNSLSGEIQDLGDQLAMLEKRVVEGEAAAAAASSQPAAAGGVTAGPAGPMEGSW